MTQILTIDIGGTKVRVVEFHDTENFQVKKETEIPSSRDPNELVLKIADEIRQNFPEFAEFSEEKIISVATRGMVNDGYVTDPPKIIDMENFPLAAELSQQLGGNHVVVGNDTKLAALGAFPTDFRGRGLYVTLSTGIGAGLLVDGQLSRDLDNLEIGHIKTWRDGQWLEWEELASGETFYQKYGDGYQIPADDPIWQDYAREVAVGILVALPTLYPDKIAIGGKISEFFDKFGPALQQIVDEFGWKANNYSVEIAPANDRRYVVNRGALVFALKQLG
ncbi:ROK family protein [Candidatus Saccharibacteria bacterium]|nr:ROK family protein [Candidatus Saccharibacteria bacterium]